MIRLAAPAVLTENGVAWGEEWEQRRAKSARAAFHWHQIDNKSVNHILIPVLEEQTQNHCSFCDFFPVSPPSVDTIEHFRPKAEYPREAYIWSNLYFCCTHCQQKGAPFSDDALRPDAEDFEFERYFRWDHVEGTILVNERGSPDDQRKADFTIRFFRLNTKHPQLRKLTARIWTKAQPEPINDFPYRQFLEKSG